MKITEHTKKNGTTVYRSQVYLGIDVLTGKKVTTRVTGRTKKEVKNKANLAKVEFINNGQTVSKIAAITTYRELADLWWDSYKHTVKTNTYYVVKGMLKHHLLKHFGDLKLDKINTPLIQRVFNDYADKYNNKKEGAYALYGTLHSINCRILQYGVVNQVLQTNPAREVVIPRKKKRTKEIVYLDSQELRKFLTYIDSLDSTEYRNLYDVTLYKLLLATGCRVGEALALDWSDIDFDNSCISITKTLNRLREANSTKSKSGTRIIDIDQVTLSMLREYKKRQTQEAWKLGRSERLVFSIFTEKYPNQCNLRSRLRKHFENLGITGLSFHAFRHTHASLLLNSGIPYKELQHRLGHSTLAMTMDTYSHLSKENAKKAVSYFEMAINAI